LQSTKEKELTASPVSAQTLASAPAATPVPGGAYQRSSAEGCINELLFDVSPSVRSFATAPTAN